jgi:outer membrane protein TolC
MPDSRFTSPAGALFICLLTVAPLHARAEVLTLARAEQTALDHAPWFQHHRTNVAAAAERVVHEGRLPDPQLTLGAVNVPTDSFSLRQDDMTMLTVGVRQNLPAGDTLAAREWRARKELSREEARLEIERRTLLKQVREQWFALWLQERSLRLVEAARALQQRALAAAEGRYRAAQERQQEVLRARQALARLDEQVLMIRAQAARRRAQLARFLGDVGNEPLPAELASLPALAKAFEPTRHPEWLAAQAGLEAAQADTDITRQEYKPGMMFDLAYGFRGAMPNGAERPDMVSAMVTFDLPLFREKRQDRRLAEKQALETAARFETEDKRRELQAMHEAARAEHEALAARVRLLENELVPNARREAEVTAAGFVRDANELRAAQMKALDAELDLIRLRVQLATSHAELLYLTGESDS